MLWTNFRHLLLVDKRRFKPLVEFLAQQVSILVFEAIDERLEFFLPLAIHFKSVFINPSEFSLNIRMFPHESNMAAMRFPSFVERILKQEARSLDAPVSRTGYVVRRGMVDPVLSAESFQMLLHLHK